MTDPTYCGFINRVRLAGGVPRLVPLIPSTTGWRLDLEALASIDPKPVRVALLFSPIPPHGGWSFVFDVSPLGIDGVAAAARLLEVVKIAAAAMRHWGTE